MSAPIVFAPGDQLHCVKCNQWLGEATVPLEYAGHFKIPRDRQMVPTPRDTRRCKACGWVTVFLPAETRPAAWRNLELKRAD